MLLTFMVIIAPFMILLPPLRNNKFFVLYFCLMIFSAYFTEYYWFNVTTFSHQAFLMFLVYHFICINFITFCAYGVDKQAARMGNWRVPESHLHTLEFLGGWIGAFAAQKFFRHKTKKRSYRIMFWLMLVLQGAAIYIILRYLGLIH